jgi:hypothetical protein
MTGLALISALVGLLQVPTDVREAAISVASRTIVAQIDPELPEVSLEAWLRGLAQEGTEISWEVNDCGEQTGNPALDRGRDFPMCADASVQASAARHLIVSLLVGSWMTGVTADAPSFRGAYIREEGGQPRFFGRLRDAVAALRGP